MDDIRTTLLPTFLQEAEGKLPVIESFLEKRTAESCDLASMDEACRAVHTLKGTAGLIKAESIRRIAMRIEDILERHLQKKTSPSAVEYDALILAQEKMSFLVSCLGSSRPEPQGVVNGVMQALDLVTTFPGQAGPAANDSNHDSLNDPFAEDVAFDLGEPVVEAATLPEDPFADDHFDLSDYDVADSPVSLKSKQSATVAVDPFADDPDFEPVTGHQGEPPAGAQEANTGAEAQKAVCCCFELSGQQYSLPIESMVEISDLPDIVALPLSPAHIRGMVNLRGKVLPLVDIPGCDGNPSSGPLQDSRMVVVDAQGEEYAFLCDGVPSLETEFSGVRIDPVEFRNRYSIGAS